MASLRLPENPTLDAEAALVFAESLAFILAVPNNLRINLSNKVIDAVLVTLSFFLAAPYKAVLLTALPKASFCVPNKVPHA